MITPEQVEAWAREAGASVVAGWIDASDYIDLPRFAALAYAAGVAAEREECAKVAELTHPLDWAFVGCAIRARTST